jgi:hypothetical protein
MLAVAALLLWLGIVKRYEPLLLLPIGAGCLLANLPLSPLVGEHGMLKALYDMGVGNEMFPLLIFIGIGALTDFGPLLENPRMVLLGAAGQFGIFATLLLALGLGFSRPEAASIGIIGAIDGPTSIYVSGILAPHLLAPITVAAYSYMSLVPIILPPIMKLLTTQRERRIRMPYSQRPISRRTRVLFPIVVTLVVGTLVPFATPLIGMLMLGNLMKESGVVERLTKASSEETGQRGDAVPGPGHRLHDAGRRIPQTRPRWPSCCWASWRLRAGRGGRRAVRQAAERGQRRPCQPAHRRRRHQRLSDGRARGAEGGPGRRLRELPAHARDGRQRRRPGGQRGGRGRAAGADGRGWLRPAEAAPARGRVPAEGPDACLRLPGPSKRAFSPGVCATSRHRR